ncbi:MFS general substrate transporter, partial [Gymnopus androsaceus JB14]
LIGSGGLLFVFCLMMTSISTGTPYYQFVLSQGIGVGLAQGMLFTPGMAVLAHHFKRYRTMVFGIFAAGASIGGVILPIALQRLFTEVGFGWGVRILGLLVLVCVGTGFVCCTTRFPPRKGGRVLDIRVCPSFTLSYVLTQVADITLHSFNDSYAPVNFGVVYATDHGMSQELAFYSLAILNAGSFIGRVLPNILATKFGPTNLLIGSCTVSSISLYGTLSGFLCSGICAFIHGYSAYVSCLPAAVASLTKNPNETGLRLGMMFFSTSFFWLVSSPIQGALIGIDGSYWPLCVFSGSTVLLGVVFMLVSRYLVQKETRTWKI